MICLRISISREIKSNKGMTNICIVRKIEMLILKHLVLIRLPCAFISDAFLRCIKASGHWLCFLYMKLVLKKGVLYMDKVRKRTVEDSQKKVSKSVGGGSVADMKPMILKSDDNEENTYVIVESIGIVDGQYGEWKKDKNGTYFQPYGSAVILEKVCLDIGTLERRFLLSFKDAQGMVVRVPFYRKDLTETEIRKFLEKGCQVTKKTIQALITSIMNQEPEAPCEMIHKTLGFSMYNDETVFLGATGIGVESKYDGSLKVRPCGKYSEWKKMVIDEVIGHTPLEFVLAVACTAPLVDYFREDFHTGNILVSMASESSSGKTTAGCFAVSAGAKSSFDGDSMITTFADTPNSIMHSIYSSYPMLIDEGSLIQKNPTSLLYSLAQGKEKARLTKALSKAEAITFSTTIFMTSEKSILGICDSNTGLFVRCIEVKNVTWTKSAVSADRIKKTCENHYGHLVWRIAEKLLEYEHNKKKKKLINKYENFQKMLIADAKERDRYNPLTERFSKSAALILLGAELASEVLEITLNTKAIQEFIAEHSQVYNDENIDIGKRALMYVCQYISKNYTNFIVGKGKCPDPDYVPSNCMGYIIHRKPTLLADGKYASTEIRMSEITFDKMIYEGGFPGKESILQRWKEDKILYCQKDRFVSKVVIGKTGVVNGYRFFLSPEYLEIVEKKKKTKSDIES